MRPKLIAAIAAVGLLAALFVERRTRPQLVDETEN